MFFHLKLLIIFICLTLRLRDESVWSKAKKSAERAQATSTSFSSREDPDSFDKVYFNHSILAIYLFYENNRCFAKIVGDKFVTMLLEISESSLFFLSCTAIFLSCLFRFTLFNSVLIALY